MIDYKSTAEPKATASGIAVYCAHDKIANIETLKPNPKNPNQHPMEQIRLLGSIIKATGWRQPITVSNLSGYVVKGHGRLMAAQIEGMTEVPVDYQNYSSEAEEMADLVADNRLAELSDLDNQMLAEIFKGLEDSDIPAELTGYTNDELLEILNVFEDHAADMELADDIMPETPEEPFTQAGDVWQIGKHRLYVGDSTKSVSYDKLLQDEGVDLIVTDPPYNVDYEGTAGKIKNDNMSDGAFDEFLYDAFTAMNEVTREGAAFYVFHSDTYGEAFRRAIRLAGYTLKENLVWVKNALVLGRQDYQWRHEPCIYGWKEGEAHFFINDRSQTTVFEEEVPDFTKWTKDKLIEFIMDHLSPEEYSTVLREKKPTKSDLHPTMKPVKLISRLIQNSSLKDWIVMDPFGGSGTTLIACEYLNRKARLIEYDPKFADVIILRYAQTFGKTDVACYRNAHRLSDDIVIQWLEANVDEE